MPVNSDARDGEQLETDVVAASKTVPRAASASRCGDCIALSPYAPSAKPPSSSNRNNTLRAFFAAAGAADTSDAESASSTSATEATQGNIVARGMLVDKCEG